MNLLDPRLLWGLVLAALHLVGLVCGLHALLTKRSSQSAIAWAFFCITFPYVAVVAYLLLGRHRLQGYVLSRRSSNARVREIIADLQTHAPRERGLLEEFEPSCAVFERLAGMPFTRGNQVALRTDGDVYFEEIFARIAEARDYILIQFFIIRGDALGRRMRDALAARVREGVRVYFLYDPIGSHRVGARFVESLSEAGIAICAFRTNRGWTHRFQLNFRNHRKMVVVDGEWAVTGGANLGAEYRGRSRRFGYWRDTMVAVRGPAVQAIQLAFAEDWYYLNDEVPDLHWQPRPVPEDNQCVLVLPTGPVDTLHACSMMFTQAIHAARDRLWITSPYFVPDQEIVRALQLAALRGVDVRILLPHDPDHTLVYWASFTYLEELEQTGVRFFRYTRGLLHEKVILVDDAITLVGSANADNRSFYLNFELTLVMVDRPFAAEVQTMLEEDFEHARLAGADDYREKGLLFHLAARLARLLSPIL